MGVPENPKIYIQKAYNNSFPIVRTKEHDDFLNGVEQKIIENITNFEEGKEEIVGIVENLPTSGVCSNNIYAQSYRDYFRVNGNLPYSTKLYKKGIAVLKKYNRHMLKENDTKYDLEQVIDDIKEHINYLKEKHIERQKALKEVLKYFKNKEQKNKEKILSFLQEKKSNTESFSLSFSYADLYEEILNNFSDNNLLEILEKESEKEFDFPNIENILFLKEEIEDNYSANEIIGAMRTGITQRDSDSASILIIKGEKLNLSKEELEEINKEIFKVETNVEKFLNNVKNILGI